jgi:hypothetical protein
MAIFKSCILLIFALVTAAFMNSAFADFSDKDYKTISNIVSQFSPAKNSQLIIDRIKALSPQVTKIPFPANDNSLKYLTNYSFDAIKNPDFKREYNKALAGLPKKVHHENNWMNGLKTIVAAPDDYYSTPVGKLVSLFACRPHDCPTQINMLYDPKAKQLWGFLHTDDQKSYLFGNPSDDQLAILFIVIGEHISIFE